MNEFCSDPTSPRQRSISLALTFWAYSRGSFHTQHSFHMYPSLFLHFLTGIFSSTPLSFSSEKRSTSPNWSRIQSCLSLPLSLVSSILLSQLLQRWESLSCLLLSKKKKIKVGGSIFTIDSDYICILHISDNWCSVKPTSFIPPDIEQ